MSGQASFGEEIVRISWAAGRIFGILHAAVERSAPRVCVIMFTAGMQSRPGPGRIYLRTARRLAAKGIDVLRVDLAGVGDSESENSETHFDCHNPDEALAAVRYVEQQLRPSAIILQGLCAGARVAVKAGEDPAVAGILAWSAPIFTSSLTMPPAPSEPPGRVSGAVARDTAARLRRFLMRMSFLDPRWWKANFPGGRGIATEAWQVVHSLLRILRGTTSTGHRSDFLQAAQSYLSQGRKILFVYGESDKLSFQEFRDHFPDLPEGATRGQGLAIVPQGSHTFSKDSAQAHAIQLSLEWIESNFAP
jgi:pimeloyl-ACP methyl ester carboxylesterase